MWMWWGPGGVQETGSFASNKMRGEQEDCSLSQECVGELSISFMTGAKDHLLCTAFLDFLKRTEDSG